MVILRRLEVPRIVASQSTIFFMYIDLVQIPCESLRNPLCEEMENFMYVGACTVVLTSSSNRHPPYWSLYIKTATCLLLSFNICQSCLTVLLSYFIGIRFCVSDLAYLLSLSCICPRAPSFVDTDFDAFFTDNCHFCFHSSKFILKLR